MPIRLCFVCDRCEKESELKSISNDKIKKEDVPNGYFFGYFHAVPNFEFDSGKPIFDVFCNECVKNIKQEHYDILKRVY